MHLLPPTTAYAVSSPAPPPLLPVSCAPTKGQPYPVFSACFIGDSPFHHLYKTLRRYGTLQPAILAQNLWAQGIPAATACLQGAVGPLGCGEGGGNGPLYWVTSGMSAYSILCECKSRFDAAYFPSGAVEQGPKGTEQDHHLASADTVYRHGETDGYGFGRDSSCALTGSTWHCQVAGFFPYSGPGFSRSWLGGNAPGFAMGIKDISAQDIFNYQQHGIRIGHALGLQAPGLSGPSVYPAQSRDTDSKTYCKNDGKQCPVYGSLIHLKYSFNVAAATQGNSYCAAVLYALQDYGAYPSDTNGNSKQRTDNTLGLDVEYPRQYQVAPFNQPNNGPWDTIFPNGQAYTCLGLIGNASNIEILHLNGKLPRQYPYGDSRN